MATKTTEAGAPTGKSLTKPQATELKKAAAPKREFLYNNAPLEDPGAHMTEKQVQALYAEFYPELTNATISIENKAATDKEPAKKIVKFVKNVGTKG